jgi:AraC family transcriptional regulator
MQIRTISADRGAMQEINQAGGPGEVPVLAAIARGGHLQVATPGATIWLAARGSAEISSSEGRHHLEPGQWLHLDRDLRPTVHAGKRALVVGIVLTPALHARLLQSAHCPLFPGRGLASARSRRMLLRCWRTTVPPQVDAGGGGLADPRMLNLLLRYLSELQEDQSARIERCPGRSLQRRRQMFARLQRALLFMEGNTDRCVRVPELAERCSMSIWYFTKTFHGVYGMTPQSALARMRLQRSRQLIRQTRMSITEVGVACGFESNCAFSRAFRAEFGMPPSTYRLLGDGVQPDQAQQPDMLRGAG